MSHNPILIQHLSDAKVAELHREPRIRRTVDVRHDAALRIARPLLRWRSH